MENQKRKLLFDRIEQSFKLKIIICIFLSLFIIITFLIANSFIDKKNSRKYNITNDINLINQLEDINILNNKINIEGYAFLLDRNSDDIDISLLLRNINDGKEIWADVTQLPREDVNAYFQSDYSYVNSGFTASVNENELKDEYFEIIIKLDYKENSNNISKAVLTNRYLGNGGIYSYVPYEFDQPDLNIESDVLKKVFNDGRLCFYRKDAGMYVYQYNDSLYWVVNKDFKFEEDGLTYIPYNLYTSKNYQLPEHRIKAGFEALDFNFEEYEYTDENTTPYRVAIRNIPDEYPITYIYTGGFDTNNSKWLWTSRINMNPIFN